VFVSKLSSFEISFFSQDVTSLVFVQTRSVTVCRPAADCCSTKDGRVHDTWYVCWACA
jgi:hypothetical protein